MSIESSVRRPRVKSGSGEREKGKEKHGRREGENTKERESHRSHRKPAAKGKTPDPNSLNK